MPRINKRERYRRQKDDRQTTDGPTVKCDAVQSRDKISHFLLPVKIKEGTRGWAEYLIEFFVLDLETNP